MERECMMAIKNIEFKSSEYFYSSSIIDKLSNNIFTNLRNAYITNNLELHYYVDENDECIDYCIAANMAITRFIDLKSFIDKKIIIYTDNKEVENKINLYIKNIINRGD